MPRNQKIDDVLVYVPEWDGVREDFVSGKDLSPVEVELHALSASEMRHWKAKVVTRVTKNGRVENPNAEEIARALFTKNVRAVRNLSVNDVPIVTGEQLYDNGDPVLVNEIAEALGDWSQLEAGRRDRLRSQSDGTPPAT